MAQDSEGLETLAERLPQLVRLAASGEMETTLVLLPESSRKSKLNSWSTKPTELRARQVEEVMTEAEEAEPAPTTAAAKAPFFPGTIAKGSIPACFHSRNSCTTATNECSGRGTCENKYAKSDGTEKGNPCFRCHCKGTVSETGSYTHWAGPACNKIDISTPFWLFAGFTIVIVGVVYLAIGLLFSVGEEQLPGVIGAGVSKSK
jgi:disulfide bond formation protein DsbB